MRRTERREMREEVTGVESRERKRREVKSEERVRKQGRRGR